ncbi:tetratricopeptide repeat protein [Acidobacteriota bacterium]
MVDELTKRIKTKFNFSETEISEDIDKNVEKITTSSPEAHKYYIEAREHHFLADYERSFEAMDKALDLDPEFAMAYRSLAVSYHNLGNFPEKKKAIQKAFELSYRVSDKERYIIAAEYHKIKNEYDKTIEAYNQVLELYPEDRIAITNLGVLYSEFDEWEKAVEFFEVNIRNKVNGVIASFNLAEGLMAIGQYERALDALRDCLKDYPDHPVLFTKIALIHVCQGEYELALTELDKAISLAPNAYRSKLKADIFQLKGDLIRAEKEYQKLQKRSIRRKPGQVSLYLLQGRVKEAVNLIRQEPVTGDYFTYLDQKLSSPDEALKKYSIALSEAFEQESYLSQCRILHAMELCYLKKKSYEEAKNTAFELRYLIQEGENKKAIRFNLHLMGLIDLESGNFSKAVDTFRNAISLLPFPFDNRFYYQALFLDSLVWAYYKAGNLEKAEEEYEKIVSLTLPRLYDGDIYAKSFFMLGKIHQEQGQPKEAVKYYQKFLDLWGAADEGASEVREAKKQLSLLQD